MNIPVSIPQCPLDVLFSLSPEPEQATDPVLLFCIDTSGSMSITSQVKPLHDAFTEFDSAVHPTGVSNVVISTLLFKVTEEGEVVYRSRLEVPFSFHTSYTTFTILFFCRANLIALFNQFVQKAVLHCVQILSEQQPNTRVGLVTFNYKVIY